MVTINTIEKKLNDLYIINYRTTEFRIIVLELMNHLLIEYIAPTKNIDLKASLTDAVTELQHCYSMLKQLEKNSTTPDQNDIIETVRNKVLGVIEQVRPILASTDAGH